MSRTRTTSLGLVANLAGESVNGTSVSPCASAGIAQSGRPNRPSPAAARPPLSTRRRLVTFFAISRSLFRYDQLEEFDGGAAPLRDARRFRRAQVNPVPFCDLVRL